MCRPGVNHGTAGETCVSPWTHRFPPRVPTFPPPIEMKLPGKPASAAKVRARRAPIQREPSAEERVEVQVPDVSHGTSRERDDGSYSVKTAAWSIAWTESKKLQAPRRCCWARLAVIIFFVLFLESAMSWLDRQLDAALLIIYRSGSGCYAWLAVLVVVAAIGSDGSVLCGGAIRDRRARPSSAI